MKQLFIMLISLLLCISPLALAQDIDWRARVQQELPLLGHRNWIMIVDSAYPLQSSPGIETIDTGGDQLQVTRQVLAMLDHSVHITPIIHLDAELDYLTDQSAPGVRVFRGHLNDLLKDRPVRSELHESLIKQIGQTGATFHILVLKTTQTIPYTSVFLELGCKYWPPQAEQQLRQAMRNGTRPQ